MKKSLFVLLSVLAFSSAAHSMLGGWSFFAPSISDKDAIDPKAAGDIVFDTSTDSFFGWDGANWIEFATSTAGNNTIQVKDVKSSGTAGGTCTSGAWRTRDLNTVVGSQTWLSLSSNQFTLDAGTYRIRATAPAFSVELHKIKLRNITDSTDDIIGSSAFANDDGGGAGNSESVSTLVGTFTISSSKTFEIQHRCSATASGSGFGNATSFSVSEVYTQVDIEKLL